MKRVIMHEPDFTESLRADILPSYNDSLMHHGIKGMHWGVRRFEDASGHITPAGKARYNDRGLSNSNKKNLKRAVIGAAALGTAGLLATKIKDHSDAKKNAKIAANKLVQDPLFDDYPDDRKTIAYNLAYEDAYNTHIKNAKIKRHNKRVGIQYGILKKITPSKKRRTYLEVKQFDKSKKLDPGNYLNSPYQLKYVADFVYDNPENEYYRKRYGAKK